MPNPEWTMAGLVALVATDQPADNPYHSNNFLKTKLLISLSTRCKGAAQWKQRS